MEASGAEKDLPRPRFEGCRQWRRLERVSAGEGPSPISREASAGVVWTGCWPTSPEAGTNPSSVGQEGSIGGWVVLSGGSRPGPTCWSREPKEEQGHR